MVDWFRVLWLVNCRFVSSRTDSSSRSPFQNRNNQQSHIINILLASFIRSVRQVVDPRFFLFCFHGPRAQSRLGHKRKEKTSVHNLPYGPRTRLIRGIYGIFPKSDNNTVQWKFSTSQIRFCARGHNGKSRSPPPYLHGFALTFKQVQYWMRIDGHNLRCFAWHRELIWPQTQVMF